MCLVTSVSRATKLSSNHSGRTISSHQKLTKLQCKLQSYTGEAPDAFFYVGTGGRPESADSSGVRIQYPAGSDSPLASYSSQDVEFSLPAGVEGEDVTWVSVWCRAFTINFGHAWLTDDIPSTAPATTGTSMIILSISALLLIATLGF